MNLVNPRWCKDKFGYILLFYEWIKMRDTTKKNEEGQKEKLQFQIINITSSIYKCFKHSKI